MDIAMIGIHKRFCDETFFEKVYGTIKNVGFDSEDIVLLVTCNRIEIYLASSFITERHPELLEKIKNRSDENIEKRFYTFIGADVLKHLAHVASGLDSLIIGESDIQNQVKKAYESMGRNLNKDGHFLFQKALHISKKLRSEFDIKPQKSLVDQVFCQIQNHIEDQDHIAFIGHSDLNQKLYKKLLEFKPIKATLISLTKPEESSIFKSANYTSYNELEKLSDLSGVICATKDRKISKVLNIKEGGWICDLSRPKIFSEHIQNRLYYDLSFFEEKDSIQALKQQDIRQKASDYINLNVKRLLDFRLSRYEYLVS
jgi:glutamyl-tRNA reductase